MCQPYIYPFHWLDYHHETAMPQKFLPPVISVSSNKITPSIKFMKDEYILKSVTLKRFGNNVMPL